MAEQEACATAVTDALAAAGESADTADSADNGLEAGDGRGESLLLPLLQGLLGGGGERLLAGLGAAAPDVVADVRRSLARLRAALAPPTDHPQARALLTLADRLEDALDAADRLDGCKKKPRRRNRSNRHTVGVTQEELEEARRLVDRDQLAMATERREPTPPSAAVSTASASRSVSIEERPTPERRESVDDEVSYHTAVAARQKPLPVAHSASFEAAPKVNRDAKVVERRAPATRKPDYFRHSMGDTLPQQQIHTQQFPSQPRMDRRPSDSRSSIAAIANKFNAQVEKVTMPARRSNTRPLPVSALTTAPIVQQKPISREESKRAPLYQPLPPSYNFAAPPPIEELSKPISRFNNNKRSRMKRANTIDVGKTLGGYRIDSDTDDENVGSHHGPIVPEFRPQTENDKKFLAFMQKNEQNQGMVNGHAKQTNWSCRFGNIKNAFESREREERSRSSSSSSAKRFWQTNEEQTPAPRLLRKSLGEINTERPRIPWAAERKEPQTIQHQVQLPPPVPVTPPTNYSSVPQSPTRPVVIKPFVAKPIPVNQFSHAPMSAFKPPKKIVSPTSAPSHIWSPPSTNNIISPTMEHPPSYMTSPKPVPTPSPPVVSVPWAAADTDKPRRVLSLAASKFEGNRLDPRIAPPQPSTPPSRPYYNPPTPPNYASPPYIQNYPVKTIPNQNNLNAPKLVKKVDDMKQPHGVEPFPAKIDAQKLQIEFYERQIREKGRRDTMCNGNLDPRKPPVPLSHSAQPTYTVTDYTPANVVSTFVPLQQTPDIEKANAHKIDYLPDVVMNEGNRVPLSAPLSPATRKSIESPYSQRVKVTSAYQNGNMIHVNSDDSEATEHSRVVTRVMRGPVCGSATITAGVRTRNDEGPRSVTASNGTTAAGAAKNLKGVLEKFSSPKHEVIAQIEKKRRESIQSTRKQVRPSATPSVQNGYSSSPAPMPAPAPAPASLPLIKYSGPLSPPAPTSPRSPATPASRDSMFSCESPASRDSSPSTGTLSKSESWHQIAERNRKPSPRRVVARAKSMHLLSVPKLFEGGIAREELTEKKRTVEAYFSGQAPPNGGGGGRGPLSRSPGGGATRAAAAQRARAPKASQSFSLGRSRTMPSVSELQFLDESNADDAFEDLVSALA